jgi:opacity protein-like surface antigen
MHPHAAVARLAVACCLLLASSHARAEQGPGSGGDYDRSGFHTGIGGVYAFENTGYDADSLGVGAAFSGNFDPRFDDSAGVEVTAGYRFHPRFDLAFQYQWLEGFDSTRGDPALELDTHRLLISGRLFLLTGRWQPYALAGVGALIVNTEIVNDNFDKPYDVDVGAAFLFGGGLDFYATRSWVVAVEGSYLVPTGPVGKAKYGTLGVALRYRF